MIPVKRMRKLQGFDCYPFLRNFETTMKVGLDIYQIYAIWNTHLNRCEKTKRNFIILTFKPVLNLTAMSASK